MASSSPSSTTSSLVKTPAPPSTWLWLTVWIVVGGLLRCLQLGSKTIWADEWSTLVFGLGHGYLGIPLDTPISLGQLLHPMTVDWTLSPQDSVRTLMAESNHPPLYFVLLHPWLKMLSIGQTAASEPGWLQPVSIAQARLLSAGFGVLGIPSLFLLTWVSFRSQRAGLYAAAFCALSPFGVYLAQENRHYTLAIVWVTLSLTCLAIAVRTLFRQAPLPRAVAVGWAVCNALGLATHSFVALAMLAEAAVLLRILIDVWLDARRKGGALGLPTLTMVRLGWVTVVTAAAGAIWLLPLRNTSSDERLTDWLFKSPSWQTLWEAPLRIVTWTLTMVLMAPVQGVPWWVTVLSGLFLLGTIAVGVVAIGRGLRQLWLQLESRSTVMLLGGYCWATVAIVLGVAYWFGADLTLAPRYQFVMYPAFMALVGAALAQLTRQVGTIDQQTGQWTTKTDSRSSRNFRWMGAVLATGGLVGCMSVVLNFAYQKPARSDLVVPVMLEAHQTGVPMLVANVHKSHTQTGDMMGLGWEFTRLLPNQPLDRMLEGSQNSVGEDLSKHNDIELHFLLAHKDEDDSVASNVLYETLEDLPRPLELWLVQFKAPVSLDSRGCSRDEDFNRKVPGYRFTLYRCQ
ncbi:MAG: hypothetical protein AB4040_13950 [Synechococcus sp.]